MPMLEKVATPETAAVVTVPDRVPPPAFVPIASVTLPLKVAEKLSPASRPETWIDGAIEEPEATLEGCTVNARWVAGPPRIWKLELVSVVRAPDDATSV